MSLVSCMFSPPEQAGCLMKRNHGTSGWKERYFVLKGSFLFWFPSRKNIARAKRLHGVVPLESAKIETELSSNMTGPKGAGHKGGEFFITITLHSSHAFSCKHPFFLLAAPNQEVQQAWINALWQAAIPRADLIQHLSSAGRLADVLAGYATNVKDNFPCADASVLSSGGRARTGALDNVGSLAGMIRRHKTAAAVRDIDQLPVVVTGARPASNVLARTTSGNLVTTASTNVVSADSFSTRQSLNHTSASGGSAGAVATTPGTTTSTKPADHSASPFTGAAATPAASSPAPAASSTAGKPQQQTTAVALSAAAGPGAAAAAASTKQAASPLAATKVEEVKAGQTGGVEVQELSLREQSLLQRQEDVATAPSAQKRLTWPVSGPGVAPAASKRATDSH